MSKHFLFVYLQVTPEFSSGEADKLLSSAIPIQCSVSVTDAGTQIRSWQWVFNDGEFARLYGTALSDKLKSVGFVLVDSIKAVKNKQGFIRIDRLGSGCCD